MTTATPRLVGVYPNRQAAERAAVAARRAGADPADIRIGDALDRVVSVEGEMRQEMDHTLAGPGNVGPFTKEMTKGMTLGVVVGAVIGAILALPFAAIGFGDFALWGRLLLVAVVGAIVGSTVGWVVGGGFAARREDEPLAAEAGVTLSVPGLAAVEEALKDTDPLRLDVISEDGVPVRVVQSAPDESVLRTIGRHAAREDRSS
jgi:outer membrane lipoprotein SlyB